MRMVKIIQRGFVFKEKKNSRICIWVDMIHQEGDKRFWGAGSEGIAVISEYLVDMRA